MTSGASTTTNTFAEHRQAYNTAADEQDSNSGNLELSLTSRILLFFATPTLIGLLGLMMAYADRDREINFDQDFVYPFLLGVLVVITIGFQTGGFKKSPEPLVAWPKVKRVRKVVHKYVDADGNEIKEEDLPEEYVSDLKKDR